MGEIRRTQREIERDGWIDELAQSRRLLRNAD